MSVRDNRVDTPDSVQTGERLQRVLASRGIASRRASEEMIRAGRVAVNGRVVTEMGTRVDPDTDDIRVDGRSLRKQRPRFVMLNKPSGFITTMNDERQRWTVMDLVDVPERVYPVGRLDRDTQGLLLLTNDGALANRVMHPRYGLTKEYHVITNTRPSPFQMSRLSDGMFVNGREVIPDECRLLRETAEGIVIKIVLHEGLYHVVRTMMETVGIDVVRLRRVRLGPLRIQGVPPGSWRDLTPGELVQLYESVGMPVEEADRINQRRPMQLDPVGGFRRGGAEDERATSGDSRPLAAGRTGPHGQQQERGRSSGPERTSTGRAPGRPHSDGGSRSPSRHRDRRAGRGR
ncbi:MAG: Ribosomal large subunit pseudouridine synthase B [uncultured Thermomicrobiales bacterium]|uniref:Pseudouridine synthase n=1 Tax=uncultured Thermomicrobiales bacterium TaxID=1645740 RepID=A0A6J4VRW1_9BACT|nr:MAG: Ribosomal large subunit pseudouridine synthase B [uncultured Thermomicrobiales bacterium]